MKPIAAGRTVPMPSPADISILGISKDHTEAATITPEAKPSSAFCSRAGISFFIKKTKAEPIRVPAKGISKVAIIEVFIFINPILHECSDFIVILSYG